MQEPTVWFVDNITEAAVLDPLGKQTELANHNLKVQNIFSYEDTMNVEEPHALVANELRFTWEQDGQIYVLVYDMDLREFTVSPGQVLNSSESADIFMINYQTVDAQKYTLKLVMNIDYNFLTLKYREENTCKITGPECFTDGCKAEQCHYECDDGKSGSITPADLCVNPISEAFDKKLGEVLGVTKCSLVDADLEKPFPESLSVTLGGSDD